MESINSIRGTSIYLVINNGKVVVSYFNDMVFPSFLLKKTNHINLLAMSTSHGSLWNASMFGVEGKSGRSSRVGNQIPQ
jgi:hypothetical protein